MIRLKSTTTGRAAKTGEPFRLIKGSEHTEANLKELGFDPDTLVKIGSAERFEPSDSEESE